MLIVNVPFFKFEIFLKQFFAQWNFCDCFVIFLMAHQIIYLPVP